MATKYIYQLLTVAQTTLKYLTKRIINSSSHTKPIIIKRKYSRLTGDPLLNAETTLLRNS